MVTSAATANDLEGAAQEKGEFAENAMDMWQLYGIPIEVLRIIREVPGETPDGKPRISLIVESKIKDEEIIQHWISGRLAMPVKRFFANNSNRSLRIVIWLDPTVGDKKYLGWTALSWDQEPDDFEIPKKAAKQAIRDNK